MRETKELQWGHADDGVEDAESRRASDFFRLVH
jgi:hypothetical protein